MARSLFGSKLDLELSAAGAYESVNTAATPEVAERFLPQDTQTAQSEVYEDNLPAEETRRRIGKRGLALIAIGAASAVAITPAALTEYRAVTAPSPDQLSPLSVSYAPDDPLACIALSESNGLHVLMKGSDGHTYYPTAEKGPLMRNMTISAELYANEAEPATSERQVDGKTVVTVDRAKIELNADMELDNATCKSKTPEAESIDSLDPKGGLVSGSVPKSEIEKASSYVMTNGKNHSLYLGYAKIGSDVATLEAVDSGTCKGTTVRDIIDDYYQSRLDAWAKNNGIKVTVEFVNEYGALADSYSNRYLTTESKKAMDSVLQIPTDPTLYEDAIDVNCTIEKVKE